MTKYTLAYFKLDPSDNTFIGDRIVEDFYGSPKEIKEHTRNLWSQGYCNVKVMHADVKTTQEKRTVQLEVNTKELRRVNSILSICQSTYDDNALYTLTKLPDIKAVYTIDCGNGFTAMVNALRRLPNPNGVYVNTLMYYNGTLVYRTFTTGLFTGPYSFDLGNEVITVEIVPKTDKPGTIKFPKLLVSVSILEDENDDVYDDVYDEY